MTTTMQYGNISATTGQDEDRVWEQPKRRDQSVAAKGCLKTPWVETRGYCDGIGTGKNDRATKGEGMTPEYDPCLILTKEQAHANRKFGKEILPGIIIAPHFLREADIVKREAKTIGCAFAWIAYHEVYNYYG